MKKIRALLALFLLAVFISGAAYATTSTIDPTVPAQNSALSSAALRAQFAAAINDVNALWTAVASLISSTINASNLTTGTVAPALLPLASTTTPGAVSVSTGLAVSSTGALSAVTSLSGDVTASGSGVLVAALANTASARSDIGLGTASSPSFAGLSLSGAGKVNLNSSALPAAQTGTVLQAANANGVQTRFEGDAFGSSAYFTGIRADGTGASPTTLQSGDEISGINAFGYNGAASVGPRASVREYAAAAWTTSSNPTYVDVATTPVGSTTMAEVARFGADGSMALPSTVTGGDMGAGTINANGLYINGQAVLAGTVAVANGGTGATTAQGALNNLNSSPTVSAAYVVAGCTGYNDQSALSTAETVAYATRTAILIPPGTEYGSPNGCQIDNTWQLQHPVVSIFGWPLGPAYGNDYSFGTTPLGTTIHIGTSTIAAASSNNCAIDINGADNFSASFLIFNGDSPHTGTVLICNSQNSHSHQDNSVNLLNVSIMDMENGIGCAVDDSTGACTGSLGNNDILVRASNVVCSQNGWCANGNLTDFFFAHGQIASSYFGALAMGPSGGYSFVGGVRIVDTRLEYNCAGNTSWGTINLHGFGPNNSLVGSQFDHNYCPDVSLTNVSSFLATGNFFFEGAFSGTATSSPTVATSILAASTSAGAGHYNFSGNSWLIGGSGPSHPNYILATSTNSVDDYISFTGNSTGPAGQGYVTAPYLFGNGTPAHFNWNNNLGDPSVSTGQVVALGAVTVTAGSSFDMSGENNSMILPVGTTGQRPTGVAGMLRYNSSTSSPEAYTGAAWQSLTSITPATLYNFKRGLVLSNDATTPNSVIDIGIGAATDYTTTVTMTSLAAFTKTTGAFTAGSGNGGLDTGSIAASSQYNVFEIGAASGSGVDYVFSLSLVAPLLPPGYSYEAYIGSFFTDGSSHIKTFVQYYDTVYWGAGSSIDISALGLSTTGQLETLSVPVGPKVQPICSYICAGTGNSCILTSADEPDQAPGTTLSFTTSPYGQLAETTTAGVANSGCPYLTTNNAGQIRARASSATTTMSLATRGWNYIRAEQAHLMVVTTGSTVTLPAGWNTAANAVIAIGEGGNGGTGGFGNGSGGGGAFAEIFNLSDAAGTSESITIGAGGSGTDTQFKTSGTLLAKHGTNASGQTGGVGGASSSSAGTVKFSGGTGGGSNNFFGAGGGGAAGPNGVGGAGVYSGSSPSNGGGGGGVNGGSAATLGVGGNGPNGTGGGTVGSNGVAAGNGSLGGGGGGAYYNSVGGAGSIYTMWGQYGPGSGGGGGGSGSAGSGGNGAGCGGGGGGAGNSSSVAGTGSNGCIILIWWAQ